MSWRSKIKWTWYHATELGENGDSRRLVLMEVKNSQDKLWILSEDKNLREKYLGLWMTQDFPFGIHDT